MKILIHFFKITVTDRQTYSETDKLIHRGAPILKTKRKNKYCSFILTLVRTIEKIVRTVYLTEYSLMFVDAP